MKCPAKHLSVVSNDEGGEDSTKLKGYVKLGIACESDTWRRAADFRSIAGVW
ncbi:MAG: hypothetical protein ABL921_17620 [Pirellula sp.]